MTCWKWKPELQGPRNLEATGLPLHRDNETIIKERFQLDKANKDTLLNEITSSTTRSRALDHHKRYIRERTKCSGRKTSAREQQSHRDRKDNYFMSATAT